MELSTILGLVFVWIFIIYGMGGNIGLYIDIPSVAVTIGGTISVTVIRYSFKQIANVFPMIMKTIFVKTEFPEEMIRKIISLSVEAKKNGILGLEKIKIENPFLKKGVQLAIDGVEPQMIEAVLSIDIASTTKRHDTGIGILESVGDTAPAFGLLGTILGLVQMLANMDDPKGLGPAMALALITTLYGVLLAYATCYPLADKLKGLHAQEMLVKQLIVNGILSIANGDHPAVVQEKLISFLKPDVRELLDGAAKQKIQ